MMKKLSTWKQSIIYNHKNQSDSTATLIFDTNFDAKSIPLKPLMNNTL